VGILGGGVVAAAVVLWENVDVRQLAPALAEPPPPPPVPQAAAPAVWPGERFSAALFNSRRNAAYFPDSTYYPAAVAAWGSVAREAGAVVREVGTADDLAALDPAEVLLLPEAPCLTTEEVAAIRRHLANGGGIVANWAMGARDGRCVWRGWQALQEFTGALDVRELRTREALYMTVPDGVALAGGLDPGTRIEVRGEPSLALRAEGTRVYWSDWALNPAPDESGGGADVAAAVVRTPQGGRVAWFGPRLDQGATPMDSLRLMTLVRNGVLWAAGVPAAHPGTWPGGRRAAVVFSMEVESQPGNAAPVARVLRAREVPGTFFAVTGIVEGDGELAATLSAAGEVGTQTSDHAPLAGRSAREQALALRRSWSEVEDWTGRGPRGLRPPEETLDAFTLRGWVRAGGDYIVALNEARSAAPERHDTEDGDVILIPRLVKDDYNVFVQDGAMVGGRLEAAWLEGTRKIRSLGGLAVLSGHTQILSTQGRLDALGAVLDTVRAEGDWWVATGGEVATWWRDRDRVRFTWVESHPDSLEMGEGAEPSGLPDLLVEGPADGEPVPGLWVEMVLPGGTDDLVPWVDGQPSDFATAEWGIRVPLGTLPAGMVRRVSLVRMSQSGSGGDHSET